MQYSIGIDIGSTTTQLLVIDNNNFDIVFKKQGLTGADVNQVGASLLSEAKKELNCTDKDFYKMVATGYGRKLFFSQGIRKSVVTEITCYAKGASHLHPKTMTIIDIGGQDSKVISLNRDGSVKRFEMNDKCAAGTGKFLEMIATQFDISLDELSLLSLKSNRTVTISNICAVFAQSEIINMISKGVYIEDIVKSANVSIVSRMFGMLQRLGIENTVMFCGGVARNKGMVEQLKEKLGRDIFLPEHVEFVGALGAALYASSKD